MTMSRHSKLMHLFNVCKFDKILICNLEIVN